MRRLAVAAAVLILAAGCDLSSSGDDEAPAARREQRGTPEGRLIRAWLGAVERGDYRRAATYFAPGAIIDQGRPYRLDSVAEARLFNASLPCRADLIELEDERGAEVLATFRLRVGPGGPCKGLVRVRYTIEDGKFTEWHQLGEPPPEQTPTV